MNSAIPKNRPLTDDEISNVQRTYDLIVNEQLPFPEGNVSNTVRLETTQGTRVMKLYPPHIPKAQVDFQANASNHIFDDNVPVPLVFPNKGGNLVTAYGDRNFIIMSFLDGIHPQRDSPETVEIIFPGLYMVLESLAKFKPAIVYQDPKYTKPLSEQLLELQRSLPSQPQDEFDRIALDYQRSLSDRVRSVEKGMEQVISPKQLIFGDSNVGAFLVRNNSLTGIIDFDNVHENRRLYDVMRTLEFLCVDKWTDGLEPHQRVNWDRAKQCIRVYASHDQSIGRELGYAPLMLQHARLQRLLDLWKSGYTDLSQKSRRHFHESRMEFLNSVEVAFKCEEQFYQTAREGYALALR